MEYERLTKQNQEPKTIFCFSGSMQDFKIYKRLQEFEDKIENGTLVELPCKVGDTVYRIRKKPYKAVLERFVVNITLCLNYKGQFEWRLFTTTEDTLGKTVFLTREEAEAKLKELQNG
jgi:hypothetical protein